MPGGIIPSSGEENVSLRHVMCNSFGFGGNDSSLILSQPETVSAETSTGASRIPALPSVGLRTLSCVRSVPEAPLDNLQEFMSPMESRRLCKLLKAAMMTSLTALRQAGVECPDAILVGTSYGMLENSVRSVIPFMPVFSARISSTRSVLCSPSSSGRGSAATRRL